jgi:hypothetical protein
MTSLLVVDYIRFLENRISYMQRHGSDTAAEEQELNELTSKEQSLS